MHALRQGDESNTMRSYDATGQPGHKKRVTINDLAQHLNLTKGTVSKALNDYADIAEPTRLRVRKAAKAMGYRPLGQAQAIRTGRSRSIGLVLQINAHDGYRPFLSEFLAGVSEGASREDWTMTVATATSDDDTLRRMEKLAEERKADGFILPRSKMNDPRVRHLKVHKIPFVIFGRTLNPDGCAWYDIQSESAMCEAVQALVDRGHQRIAFVPGNPGYTYTSLRLEGYRLGLRKAGLQQDPRLIGTHAVSRAEGAATVSRLLEKDPTISAVLCSVDEAALGAYDAARAAGRIVGKEFSVVAYDGIPEGTLIDPPLATFRVDNRRAGRRLAELLIRRIRGGAVEDLRELDRATFLERASMGPGPYASDQFRQGRKT